jgi:subtilisin-like proprotein convertase family protein
MRNTKHSSSKNETVKRLLTSTFAVFLILTIVIPTWAVVFSNTAAITINDAIAQGVSNLYPSTINVTGMTGNITNITVRLENLNHTFPADLDIMLVAPNGDNIVLLSDTGGANDVFFGNITFDDAAASTVGTTITTGTYQTTRDATADTFPAPAPAVGTNTTLGGAFNGDAPNGTWSLYVVDDAGADQGTLGNGWSLTITTTGSPATTFRNNTPMILNDGSRSLATSNITVSGLTGAVTDVNVTLNGVNHLNPDDLDILLISPSGKRMLIMSDAGGTGDVVNFNLTFDDQAAAAITTGGPIAASGSFQPSTYDTGDTIPNQIPPHPQAVSGGGTATLASVFNGTEANGVWQLLVVDDVSGTTVGNNIMGGWSIDITAGGTFGAKRFTNADFDGDGRTDTSVFRSSDRFWYLRDSFANHNRFVNFGAAGDIPVPGDYDGDLKHDLAVFRPSNGQWIIQNSSTGVLTTVSFGASGDRAVPADYDGDGRFDIAVFRSGVWYIRNSNSGGAPTLRSVTWGTAGDIPVRGHFSGLNTADVAVYRPSNGTWYVAPNGQGGNYAIQFGATGDIPVPGNYDGDLRSDIAVFRPSDGTWNILFSANLTTLIRTWGANGDVPVPGDYDGDSVTDTAVWRNGFWYILNSGTSVLGPATRIDYWGAAGDTPLASAYQTGQP